LSTFYLDKHVCLPTGENGNALALFPYTHLRKVRRHLA